MSRAGTLRRCCYLLALVGIPLASCGSPTAPDPRVPPTTGSPTRLMVIDWRFLVTETAARAEATWGYTYSTTRDVTAEAAWISSAPNIVSVVAPGHLISKAVGDAEVQVVFRGVSVAHQVRVYEGEPPLLVLGTGFEVGGRIRDTSGAGVPGVTIEIIGGHNVGRTAVTDSAALYRFLAPWVCGPVTARATKSGYREAVGSSVMCMEGKGMPELVMVPES